MSVRLAASAEGSPPRGESYFAGIKPTGFKVRRLQFTYEVGPCSGGRTDQTVVDLHRGAQALAALPDPLMALRRGLRPIQRDTTARRRPHLIRHARNRQFAIQRREHCADVRESQGAETRSARPSRGEWSRARALRSARHGWVGAWGGSRAAIVREGRVEASGGSSPRLRARTSRPRACLPVRQRARATSTQERLLHGAVERTQSPCVPDRHPRIFHRRQRLQVDSMTVLQRLRARPASLPRRPSLPDRGSMACSGLNGV